MPYEPGYPGSGDANVTYTGQPGRILDPVRAAALHQARELVEVWPEDRLDAGRVVEVAKVFEAYLAGPESEVP